MAAGLSISRLDVQALDLPLRAPFGISGGSQSVARNVLAAVALSDGSVGLGEAAPLPAYNGETQAAALATLQAAAAWVPGRDPSRWEEIGEELARRAGAGAGSARCALETALLDALGRSEGRPLWRFFGGAGTELETDMTIPLDEAAEAGEAAGDILRRGIRIIKVKVGDRRGPGADLERIEAIARAAPSAPLILDGNAGLSRAAAAELARGLRRRGIAPALIEQWLPAGDLEGMAALQAETGWPVAADESVVRAADVHAVARAGAARCVNIKLMKAGIAEARRVAAAARERGLGLMIGGNIESILAMTVSACFAAGGGGFAYADLDTPLFIARSPFRGGFALEGGRISVAAIGAGHGVDRT